MFYKNKKMETNPSFFCVSESLNSSPILYLVTQSAKNSNPFKPTKKTPLGALNTTEDMGFEPTHAVTRLPRFQHGLLSLLSNLPILTKIVYHKATYLAIKILEIRKMIEFERK